MEEGFWGCTAGGQSQGLKVSHANFKGSLGVLSAVGGQGGWGSSSRFLSCWHPRSQQAHFCSLTATPHPTPYTPRVQKSTSFAQLSLRGLPRLHSLVLETSLHAAVNASVW